LRGCLAPRAAADIDVPFLRFVALYLLKPNSEERKFNNMPCTLSPSTTGNEDFTAATGAAFTLDMIGAAGSSLVIVSMSYNGTNVTKAPFKFNVAAATNFLFIHYEALVPGAKLQVVETCSGGTPTQILETMTFDPGNPGTGYEITGT
jgi:hypothetical protein